LAVFVGTGFLIANGASVPKKQAYSTWSDYGGAADSMQYSALKQINKTNVSRLEQAWFYPVPGRTGRFGFNPLIVDGVMYVLGKSDSITALEAVTGKEIWSHPAGGLPTDRGINYWESKDRSDRRLIFAANSYLQEVNARTGVTIPSFGNDGRVNLREGLGRDPKTIRNIQSGTPGRVFENLIILGSATGEGYGDPPGDLRAYDVQTGKLVWTFHTIPHPGEFGYDTWPKDAWKYVGGTNTWGEISIDEKRGIAYFPLGSPTFDLYGGDRIGANLFGDCLLALDARTGKRLWHFQAVHHDLWDYDLTTAPKLLTVRHNGKPVDIVAQATKIGFVYVFNRVTGEPLWPIEERPVPKTDVAGEESWPTQPFPTKPPPFALQRFTSDDLNPYLDAEEAGRLREILAGARNEGVFTPPTSGRNQISVPGEFGGANWGGAAGDPQTGMLYVRSHNAPAMHQLSDTPPPRVLRRGTPEQQGHAAYAENCERCHGAERTGVIPPKELGAGRFQALVRSGRGQMPGFSEAALPAQSLDALTAYLNNPEAGAIPDGGRFGPPAPPPPPPGQVRYYGRLGTLMAAGNGLPVIRPPWSVLTAYDLNDGTIAWQAPLGTIPSLAGKGIRNTGNHNLAWRCGLAVTAGGLIFVGSWSDRTVHAYDKDTGKVLWEKELDANPEGIPAVYEAGGREYIVFSARAGLNGNAASDTVLIKAGKPEAQGYYVFALPRSRANQ
jgi:quinoprotein glucose dehydrogenase